RFSSPTGGVHPRLGQGRGAVSYPRPRPAPAGRGPCLVLWAIVADERDRPFVAIIGRGTRHRGGCWKGDAMSFVDKAKNKAEELMGKGKEAAGEATDDDELKVEGKADQIKANLKQAGEKIKDAFK